MTKKRTYEIQKVPLRLKAYTTANAKRSLKVHIDQRRNTLPSFITSPQALFILVRSCQSVQRSFDRDALDLHRNGGHQPYSERTADAPANSILLDGRRATRTDVASAAAAFVANVGLLQPETDRCTVCLKWDTSSSWEQAPSRCFVFAAPGSNADPLLHSDARDIRDNRAADDAVVAGDGDPDGNVNWRILLILAILAIHLVERLAATDVVASKSPH